MPHHLLLHLAPPPAPRMSASTFVSPCVLAKAPSLEPPCLHPAAPLRGPWLLAPDAFIGASSAVAAHCGSWLLRVLDVAPYAGRGCPLKLPLPIAATPVPASGLARRGPSREGESTDGVRDRIKESRRGRERGSEVTEEADSTGEQKIRHRKG